MSGEIWLGTLAFMQIRFLSSKIYIENYISLLGSVCEFLEGGTLQSLIDEGMINNKTGHPYSLYLRMKMARDIVKGYDFIF